MPGYQPRHDTDPVWFNGTQVNNLTVTSDQTGVLITAVHGWDDRPDVRDVRSNRSGQDGEYADNLYLGGRTITIEGEVYGSTWANLQSRKRTLAALFIPTSTEVLLKIPDPSTTSPTAVYASTGMTGYERSSVRVVEAIRFGETRDPRCQVFQVVVRASDPRIYSDVATSTDSGTSGTAARTVTVDQGGTYETPPTVTATGPTAATWSVYEPSSGLVVGVEGLALGSGEAVAIDVDDRRLTWTAAYQRARTLRSDVIAGWMFNETSGTTADNIQGTATYDLTYTGGFTLNQSGHASGVASVALNGTTGYMTKSYTAGLNTAATTLEGWVKVTGSAGSCVVSCVNATYNQGYYLAIDHSAGGITLQWAASVPVMDTIYAPLPVSVGTWMHVAFTLKNGEQRLYVNGEVVGSGASGFVPATAQSLDFGRLQVGPTAYVAGNFGPWFMFSSALTESEVANLYAASASTMEIDAYSYVDASSSRWRNLGTSSSVFTLASSGLNTGSKLNATYRDARI